MKYDELKTIILDLIKEATEDDCDINTNLSELFDYDEDFVEDVAEPLEEKLNVDLNFDVEVKESDIRTDPSGRVTFRPVGNPIFVGTFMGDLVGHVKHDQFDYYNSTVKDFIDFIELKTK
ncbi:MAG: hypothetical protein AAGK10_22210 [Cyanobacteria bacterium J06555_3]